MGGRNSVPQGDVWMVLVCFKVNCNGHIVDSSELNILAAQIDSSELHILGAQISVNNSLFTTWEHERGDLSNHRESSSGTGRLDSPGHKSPHITTHTYKA